MHSTGEKVQCSPVAAISTAAARAPRSTRSGSQVQAMPSWVGKIVAPGQKECPWMQSSAISSGICSRVFATSCPGLDHPFRRGMQQRSGELAGDEVLQVAAGVQLEHLPDLLGEGHSRQEIIDPVGEGQPRVEVGQRRSICVHSRVP